MPLLRPPSLYQRHMPTRVQEVLAALGIGLPAFDICVYDDGSPVGSAAGIADYVARALMLHDPTPPTAMIVDVVAEVAAHFARREQRTTEPTTSSTRHAYVFGSWTIATDRPNFAYRSAPREDDRAEVWLHVPDDGSAPYWAGCFAGSECFHLHGASTFEQAKRLVDQRIVLAGHYLAERLGGAVTRGEDVYEMT